MDAVEFRGNIGDMQRFALPTAVAVALVVVSCLIVGPACNHVPAGAQLDGRAPDVLTASTDADAQNVEATIPVMSGDGAVAGHDSSPDREPPDSAAHGGPPDATADSARALDAVRIIRGEPTQTTWFDLTFVGSGLQEYEDAVVNARIGSPDRPPERLGSGQARIVGGAFEMVFPDVLEPGLYKFKRFFIDLNGNGLCDTGEPVYSDARFATADLVLTIRPGGSLMARDGNRCSELAKPWPEQ